MKEKRLSRFALIACAMLMLVSCIIPAAVAIAPMEQAPIVIDGEVGDKFVVGGFIVEIVSDEEMDRVLSVPQTRASEQRWEIDLEGDSMSEPFSVTKDYKYAKVWIRNDLPESNEIVFNITKGTSTGTVIIGSSARIAGGTAVSVYSSTFWLPDTYYANFTCGKADMVGKAACRVASTKAELDI